VEEARQLHMKRFKPSAEDRKSWPKSSRDAIKKLNDQLRKRAREKRARDK